MDGRSKAGKLLGLWRHRLHLKQILDWHLFVLEQPGATVWGGVTDIDEQGIREAVVRAAGYDGPIVEIGALFGWTTQLIASVKAPAKELITVENFCWNPFMVPPDDHRVITRRTLRYCIEHCRTQIFDGSNVDFYKTYGGPRPSMVFIDADHSYEESRRDIEWARSLRVPIIAGHDYGPLHPGVTQAVHENFGKNFDLHGSVWIARGDA